MNIVSNFRKANVIAIARLPNYKLAFYEHSNIWDGGAETFIEDSEKDLWGIVCQLVSTDSDILDIRQDAKQDGTGDYFHTPEDVIGENGELYPVLVYKKATQGRHELPSEEQIADIISNAKKYLLPIAYIEELKNIPTGKARYPVPKKSNLEIFFKKFSACDC